MTGNEGEVQGTRRGTEREMKGKGTRNEGERSEMKDSQGKMNEGRCRREMTGNEGDVQGKKRGKGQGNEGNFKEMLGNCRDNKGDGEIVRCEVQGNARTCRGHEAEGAMSAD